MSHNQDCRKQEKLPFNRGNHDQDQAHVGSGGQGVGGGEEEQEEGRRRRGAGVVEFTSQGHCYCNRPNVSCCFIFTASIIQKDARNSRSA